MVRTLDFFSSTRPRKTVHLAFKFCPTRTVCLDCSKVSLIKVISNIKKELHREGYEANQMLILVYATFLTPVYLHLLSI